MKYKLEYTGIFPNKNDILISCSIFKLKNPYKDFNIYIDGLKMYINKILLNNMKMIVYYDDSIKNDENFKKIFDLYNTKILFCYYRFKDFIEDGYHNGLFGTFIRIMPIFMHKIKYKCLFITDIDYEENEIDFFSYIINKFIKSEYNITVFYSIGYENIYKKLYCIPNTNITLLMPFLSKKKYYNFKNIFIDFLNKLNNNDKDIKQIVEKRINLTSNTNNIKLINNKNTIFSYGIDEFFQNIYSIPFFMKYENKIGVIYINGNIQNYIKNILNNNNLIYKKIYNKIIKKFNINDNILYLSYQNKLNDIITNGIGINETEKILNYHKVLKLYIKYIMKLYKKYPNKRYDINSWINNLKLYKYKGLIISKIDLIKKYDLLKIYDFNNLLKLKSI